MSNQLSERPSGNLFPVWVGYAAWLLVAIWFVIWVYMLPRRGLVSALDFTNPSPVGLLSISAILVLVAHYRFLRLSVVAGILGVLLVILFAPKAISYYQHRPLSLAAGETLVVHFQVLELPDQGANGFVVEPPFDDSRSVDSVVQVFFDGELMGTRESKTRMDTELAGMEMMLINSLPSQNLITKPGTGRMEVTYSEDMSFPKPIRTWIYTLRSVGEGPEFEYDIEPAIVDHWEVSH